jgi:hypothetical protein
MQLLVFLSRANILKILSRWAWWYMPVMTAFGKLRQENSKFEANLFYYSKTLPHLSLYYLLGLQ